MNNLLFGTAGIPNSTQERTTINGIKEVKKLGLDSMELEFVHSVNLNEEKCKEVKETAKKENIILTTHGQYAINLNALEKSKLEASKERILKGCKVAYLAGSWSICYHIAYYMELDKNKVIENVKKSLKEITKKLNDENIDIWLRPETGGKLSQCGDIDELIKISEGFDKVLPCIDFAHHYSRSLGKCNKYEDWSLILTKLERGLGKEALKNMHIHTEGIHYNDTGERYHMNLNECKINWKDLVKVWKDFNIKGVVTCESPNLEKDALLLKNTYQKL